MSEQADGFVQRLERVVEQHDLDAVVDCFAPDYRNETPAHPGRGFVGREQVRTNWARMFAGIPDLEAEAVRTVVDGDVVWSEWEMRGTRPDGGPHLLRGVIIFGIADDRASWARFYLEPVDDGEGGVDAAVGRIVDATGRVTAVVRDARPPALLVRVLNPIMRTVLRTPLGRLVRPLALLEFTGRRTGTRYRVPVGLYDVDGVTTVFTPAAWRVSFAGGADAAIRHRGRRRRMTGTLVTDPAEVARGLCTVLDGGASAGSLGLDVPTSHRVDASDVVTLGRAMICFEPRSDAHEEAHGRT